MRLLLVTRLRVDAMRLIATAFLALLIWTYTSYTAGSLGYSKWIPAICLILVSVGIQFVYAKLVNSWFDAVGLTSLQRARLRHDRGVVPFWVAWVGILARSFMASGTIMPILEATGCWVQGSTPNGS